jgi:hypothetical protein
VCACWIQVADGTVYIRPCVEHDGLADQDRWEWLVAMFDLAGRLEAAASWQSQLSTGAWG